jgi:hypothetical protein
MGKDTPDWGGRYNNAVVYPLDDVGEAAYAAQANLDRIVITADEP